MPNSIPVALLGTKFMGRAHSNAWSQVAKFFELPLEPALEVVAGRDREATEAFARRWGWSRATCDWRSIARDPRAALVDVSTPNDAHAEQSIAMLEAGKHVACEKPLAGTLSDARAMAAAAKNARGGRARPKTFVWFNYRRCPAVGLAWRLIREGRLGTIYHVRAQYLQSWGGPETPLVWRFRKSSAGSGAHGDLNAHIVDLARFLTGDEVSEVHGAVSRTFVKERAIPGSDRRGKSDVDDAVLFLASFRGGAVASFEATRLAAPHQNQNRIEINGARGAIAWDFERMNELLLYDAEDGPREHGWRRVMCTSAQHHPYAASWWPDAHVLGYEHGFTNMAADVLRVLAGEQPELPLPDFADAYETQRVLEAALVSARERAGVKLSEIA
jgi:predicted dehydrogenase